MIRFVLVSAPRCGSNHVMDMFRSDPRIAAYPELFVRRGAPIYWPSRVRPHFEALNALALRDRDPIRFLDEVVFGPSQPQPGVEAVGFKIFYDHAADHGWSCVWDYIKSNDLRIIHLRRADILKSLVSLRLAQSSGAWTSMDRRAGREEIVMLQPRECVDYFERIEGYWRSFDSRFAANPVTHVEYDCLCRFRRKEMSRLQRFLGLEPRPLSRYIAKQNPLPVQCYLSNYHELKRQFTGTQWQKYFHHAGPHTGSVTGT